MNKDVSVFLQRRAPIIAVVFVSLAVIGLIVLQTAFAAGSMNISGYAWSSNIGWISMSGPGYGVSEDKVSGALSGYAWSSNFGWISFNVSDGTHTAPRIDFTTGRASGWARACGAFADKNACSGALDGNSGDWDGWIALAGTAVDSTTYGIIQGPTCAWTGYAWGSSGIGAISVSGLATNGSPYGVIGDDIATCVHLNVACSGSPSTVYTSQPVTWTSTVSGGGGSYGYSWSGTDSLSGTTASVQKSYAIGGLKTATLTVTDINSGVTAPATCAVGAGSTVTVNECTASLAATPNTVEQGQSTTLTWSVTGGALCAASCSGSGFNTGGATSGSAAPAVAPTPPSTSYALTCVGGTYGPPPPANATVDVLVPTATITANGQSGAARVNPALPNNVTIVWSSSHATSCSVTKNGAAWRSGLSSSGVTDSATTQTVYKIDCQNTFNTHAIATVIVDTPPDLQEF